MTREEWDKLTPDEQYQHYYWRDWTADRLDVLLEAIPPCPQHGPHCISHAMAWIKEQIESKEKVSGNDL